MSIMSTGGGDLERRSLRVGAVGYTVGEVAHMLRISRNAVYDMVAREEITAVKVGRLLRIPAKPFHSKFGDTIPE
jgi:excisionase family DNA binding protein